MDRCFFPDEICYLRTRFAGWGQLCFDQINCQWFAACGETNLLKKHKNVLVVSLFCSFASINLNRGHQLMTSLKVGRFQTPSYMNSYCQFFSFFCSVINDWLPTFYHLNSKLLALYSRHGMNNGPFDEITVLDHLNTQLVCSSDPHCNLNH